MRSSKMNKWFKTDKDAKSAAKSGNFASYFRIVITKRDGCTRYTKYFVDIFLPAAIKNRIKAGSAKVEELLL